MCRDCALTKGADPSQFENAVPKLTPNLPELIRATYPNIYTREGERLALEERVHHVPDSLPRATHFSLIKEPFVLIAFHKINGVSQTGPRPALALLAAFILPFFVAAFTSAVPQLSTVLAIATFFGCIGYALWAGVAELLAQQGRNPEALLSRALIPLKPSHEELAGVLNDLEVRGLQVWKRQNPEKILKRMAAYEAKSANAAASKRPAATDV